MPCAIQTDHKGPPPTTTLTCGPGCDPVYRKKITGKNKKGEDIVAPEEVKRTCRRITLVTWNEKKSTFNFGNTYCACVIVGDFCKYVTETDPKDAGKLTKVACEGNCEELWYDKEFSKPVSSTCGMIIEPDNSIKCVCYAL
jgi:hypothetical protein